LGEGVESFWDRLFLDTTIQGHTTTIYIYAMAYSSSSCMSLEQCQGRVSQKDQLLTQATNNYLNMPSQGTLPPPTPQDPNPRTSHPCCIKADSALYSSGWLVLGLRVLSGSAVKRSSRDDRLTSTASSSANDVSDIIAEVMQLIMPLMYLDRDDAYRHDMHIS